MNCLYDANGNTLSDPSGKSYAWDFENRLTQAVVPGTGTVAFKYDPFGRRIYKSSPTFTGIFAYDRDNLIETVNASGSEIASYTRSKRLDEPLAELRHGTTSYYEQDGLGSVTSLSNSAGAVAETYAYDSYGNVTASTGTLVNPFQYTGREFDSETGVYYYRARYFDPSTGRFLSQDPIRFMGGSNFYGYARNNPVRRIDPFGYRSSGWGTMYLGPDGTWYNDGPLASSDVPEGCTAAQWAQSPGACAGPQGPDEPVLGLADDGVQFPPQGQVEGFAGDGFLCRGPQGWDAGKPTPPVHFSPNEGDCKPYPNVTYVCRQQKAQFPIQRNSRRTRSSNERARVQIPIGWPSRR